MNLRQPGTRYDAILTAIENGEPAIVIADRWHTKESVIAVYAKAVHGGLTPGSIYSLSDLAAAERQRKAKPERTVTASQVLDALDYSHAGNKRVPITGTHYDARAAIIEAFGNEMLIDEISERIGHSARYLADTLRQYEALGLTDVLRIKELTGVNLIAEGAFEDIEFEPREERKTCKHK